MEFLRLTSPRTRQFYYASRYHEILFKIYRNYQTIRLMWSFPNKREGAEIKINYGKNH